MGFVKTQSLRNVNDNDGHTQILKSSYDMGMSESTIFINFLVFAQLDLHIFLRNKDLQLSEPKNYF